MVGTRDRLFSGWRIKAMRPNGSKHAFLSARHYATEFKTTELIATAPLRPENQKGLSGFSTRGPKSDLLELGIKAVTINLVLNRFISDSDGPGRELIPAPGAPVYFKNSAFLALDQLIEYCRQHNIIVTAIVLIPRTKRSEAHAILQHPEAESGVYTMPNLSTSRGTSIYGYLLSRIAKRYSNPDRSRRQRVSDQLPLRVLCSPPRHSTCDHRAQQQGDGTGFHVRQANIEPFRNVRVLLRRCESFRGTSRGSRCTNSSNSWR